MLIRKGNLFSSYMLIIAGIVAASFYLKDTIGAFLVSGVMGFERCLPYFDVLAFFALLGVSLLLVGWFESIFLAVILLIELKKHDEFKVLRNLNASSSILSFIISAVMMIIGTALLVLFALNLP